MITHIARSVAVAGIIACLNACGGGGGTSSMLSSGSAPTITSQPTDQSVVVGQAATFTVTASGSMPLTYQWSKNGTDISAGTAASYTTPATTSADNNAQFTVKVTNSLGSVTSNQATLTVGTSTPTPGTTDVTTFKNDVSRSGLNATETILTPSTVNSANFGKLRVLAVDGKVDAQPLYLAQLSIGGAMHNVVFVVTEHDSVYAFDSDTGSTLWHVSVLASGDSPSNHSSCSQIAPEIGVTSTPVIDRNAGAHGTIYLVSMSQDSGGQDHQRMHALDITTGAELLGGPTEITAMVSGNGGANTFLPGQYAARAGLLLSKGVVYTAFTSHCDAAPYSGWLIGFSQSTLQLTSVLNVAPNSSSGPAIWMAGGGLAPDSAGAVYFLTANGAFDTTLDANGFPNKGDFGNSFVKVTNTSGTLNVADYFAMSNAVAESNADQDLGSGGILLLPDMKDSSMTVQHLAVGAGKDGNVYVVSRDSLGKFNASSNNIYQQVSHAVPGGVFASPAYFNNTLYYGDVGASLKAFAITNAKLATTPGSQSSTQYGYPGASPVVSANGTSNGIVWAYENASGGAVLHAYDATDLSHELYNSNQAANTRDNFGSGNKFIAPMVADGKVFAGTTNSVAVFGMLH